MVKRDRGEVRPTVVGRT